MTSIPPPGTGESIPDPREVYVVIPAYNENSVLRGTVTGVLRRGYSVVVVDDGSVIPAREYLAGFGVYLLRHSVNLGQGAALRTGSEFAISCGARAIVHFDADGQHDPALIERMLAPITRGEADVVLGSRFLTVSDAAAVPLVKRIMLRAGIFVSWVFTGIWLTDTHNGFRAMSLRGANGIRLEENGFAHATEILDLIRRSRLRWAEVPVTVQYTEYSRGKGQSIFNSINILFDLVVRKVLG
jgi:glycosyltransferase involved in cell wall biosynthesis